MFYPREKENMDSVDNYPGNSQYKKEKKVSKEKAVDPVEPVAKIVSGGVTRRKKSPIKRFADTFFGGSSPRDIWAYVLLDVLVPAGRDMIASAAREGIELFVYPDGRRMSARHSSSRSNIHSRVRYDVISGPSGRPRERDISRRARGSHDFDEIILDSRVEAEEVIQQLFEYLERYEEVSVWQLYGLVGITPNYTDQKYGWLDLRGLRPVRTRGGQYLLDLPKPEPLD